jgi:hypothetical protein
LREKEHHQSPDLGRQTDRAGLHRERGAPKSRRAFSDLIKNQNTKCIFQKTNFNYLNNQFIDQLITPRKSGVDTHCGRVDAQSDRVSNARFRQPERHPTFGARALPPPRLP